MDKQVAKYMRAIPDDKRPLFNQLEGLILKMYPDAAISISYDIPTYRTSTGRIYLGLWKGGVSLYTGGVQFEAFKAKHPEFKTNRGTINFKLTDKVPVADVKKIIKEAMERTKPAKSAQATKSTKTSKTKKQS